MRNVKLIIAAAAVVFISNYSISQINRIGEFKHEGIDMFWNVKTGGELGAPENVATRGRTVDFNIDIDETITSASLEFAYFDGDYLVGNPQDFTSFDVLVNGQIIDSVKNQGNKAFAYKNIDVTNLVKDYKNYSFPVVFSMSTSTPPKDGFIITRPYIIINGTKILAGEYRHEGWDMFWLAKVVDIPSVGVKDFASRGRTVDFNIDIEDTIVSAYLEFDYFDGDHLFDLPMDLTSFDVLVNGEIIHSEENQNNETFLHRSINVTNLVKNSNYSFPVVFALSKSNPPKDGVVIARPYLVINGSVISGSSDEESNKSQFLIYPNPTKDIAKINFSLDKASQIDVSVFSIDGQLVKQFFNGVYGDGVYEESIDLSGLDKGTYLINFKRDDKIISRRIVKY